MQQPQHLPREGDRRELNSMLGKLAPGDVVTVTRIDRLARSTFDLFGIVKRIVDAKAQFRSLAEPWADTGTSTGRLMLAVLGGLRTWNAILSAPAPPKAGAAPGPRKAHGPTSFRHTGTDQRGHQTPRTGRDVTGIGGQLRSQHGHHAPRYASSLDLCRVLCKSYRRGPFAALICATMLRTFRLRPTYRSSKRISRMS